MTLKHKPINHITRVAANGNKMIVLIKINYYYIYRSRYVSNSISLLRLQLAAQSLGAEWGLKPRTQVLPSQAKYLTRHTTLYEWSTIRGMEFKAKRKKKKKKVPGAING